MIKGITKDNFANALTAASLSFANTGDFVVSIMGPVQMESADFVEEITSQLRFDIPLKDLLALNLGSNILIGDLFTLSGVKSILGDSSIALDVSSSDIKLPLGLALPNLAPIPRKFDFLYTTSLDIIGSSVPLLHSVVSPISVARTNMAISVNTSVTVMPTNNEQAAKELAAAINPILASTPSASQIGFGNLAFLTEGKKNLKWADDLFGGRNITIHLPAINKDALIESILNSKTDFGITSAVRDLITINNMDVARTEGILVSFFSSA